MDMENHLAKMIAECDRLEKENNENRSNVEEWRYKYSQWSFLTENVQQL